MAWWKKLPVSQETVQRTHMALECTQTHLLWDSAPEKQLEGCQQHTGSGGSAWKKAKSPANGSVPSQTPLSHTVLQSRLSHAAEYLRLGLSHQNRLYWHKRWSQSHFTQYTGRSTGRLPNWRHKEIWPKWKNRSKLQKKTKWNTDSQSIRCRVQNTGGKDA